MMDVVRLVRTVRPRTVALPHWNDRHPDHRAASDVLTRAVFKSGLRRFGRRRSVAGADWLCYYFINDADPASFAVDVSEHYDKKREALACHRSQFTPSGPGSIETRLTAPLFRQLIESRDAHLGALHRRRIRRGRDRARSAPAPHLFKDWTASGARRPSERRHRLLRVGRRERHRRDRARASRWPRAGMRSTSSAADTPFRFGGYQPGL